MALNQRKCSSKYILIVLLICICIVMNRNILTSVSMLPSNTSTSTDQPTNLSMNDTLHEETSTRPSISPSVAPSKQPTPGSTTSPTPTVHNIPWCHWVDNAKYAPEPMSHTVRKRLDFLSLIQASKVEYVLYTGTLLGSVRHNGIIPGDSDLDIVLYPSWTDPRFSNVIAFLNDADKSRHEFSVAFATILWDLIQNSSNSNWTNMIIVKNAYNENGKVQIVFNDSKYFDIKANRYPSYICTLSVGETSELKHNLKSGHLIYPFVLDVGYHGMSFKEQSIRQYGPMCKCKLYDTVHYCHEFSHLTMLRKYGETYMIPLNHSGDNLHRRYGNNRTSASHQSKRFIEKEMKLLKQFQSKQAS
eukprot:49954_1